MARGLNKHTIIGNLGADPDVRYTQNNTVVTRISVATTELVSTNGQSKEETEWHTVVLFGKRAEIARDYLSKGSPVYIEGRVKTNRWNDRQTGQQRSVKEINATDMRLLDGGVVSALNSNNLSSRNNSALLISKANSLILAAMRPQTLTAHRPTFRSVKHR